MSCICDKYDCINVLVSPADTGVSTGLLAPVAGDYKINLEFDSSIIQSIVSLEVDDLIILPNVVNGNYTHLMEIYLPDGSLLNGVCYWLKVQSVYNAGNSLTPSQTVNTKACSITVYISDSPDPSLKYPLCNGGEINLEYPEGQTLTIPHLANKQVNRPFFIDNSVEQSPDWNSITATWTLPTGSIFSNLSKVTIQYDEPTA